MNYAPVLLLVDPDTGRRQTLAEGLQGDAFRLQSIGNFKEAWHNIQQQSPNLIFCAGDLLVEEALELCKNVKHHIPALPFIAFALEEKEDIRLHFLEMGADEFIGGEHVAEALRQATHSPAPGTAAKQWTPAVEQQMFFKLKQGEIGNVLQFLNFSTRNGHLELRFTGNPPKHAVIRLNHGEVVHLEYAGTENLEAMALIINSGEAEAHFYETPEAPAGALKLPLSQLMIEATVLADENQDAKMILDNPALIPQRLQEQCPTGGESDSVHLWELIDGVSSIREILDEFHPRSFRGPRSLKKLLELKAIQLTAPDKIEINPGKRLEALFNRIRRQVGQTPDPEYQKSLFSHLQSLCRDKLTPDQALNVSMRNFPMTLSIQHATCRAECGNQALLVEGSRLECSCCGTPMLIRNGVSYVLKEPAAGT